MLLNDPAFPPTCFIVRDHNGQQPRVVPLISSQGVARLHYSAAKRLWIMPSSWHAGWGVSMWNERKMPERWYGLLRQRMQVEEQRMRVIKDGDIIEYDDLEKLIAQADSLDREMRLVMRQAIAGTIIANAA